LAACLGLVVLSVGVAQHQRAAEAGRVSPEARVVAGVQDKYPGRFDLSIEGRRVILNFAVGADLEEEARWMFMVGETLPEATQLDVRRILEGIVASGFDYEQITIRGWFPMLDESDDPEEIVVVDVEYGRSTMDGIDWSAVPPDETYVKADKANLHREFRTR